MIKLAVFDLDGTLVDSLGDLAAASNKALEQNGLPVHPTESYRYLVGNGVRKLIERAVPEGTPPEKVQKVFEDFSANYEKGCLDRTRPYDGIKELLSDLCKMGIRCAVASNKPDEFSHRITDALFDSDAFSLVRGKLETAKTKPAPDIVYSICESLDIPVENAVMIGDSDVDVITAHNAGIPCIGCTWGFRGEEELKAAGAEFTADTPKDIADIIKREAEADRSLKTEETV